MFEIKELQKTAAIMGTARTHARTQTHIMQCQCESTTPSARDITLNLAQIVTAD